VEARWSINNRISQNELSPSRVSERAALQRALPIVERRMKGCCPGSRADDALRKRQGTPQSGGRQLVAKQSGFLARGFQREAPQQDQKRLDVGAAILLALGQDALNHAALEPDRAT
jgi:hypothetical protein